MTAIGDKWVSDCGSVTLYCGDCLSLLPTLKADAVVTDPPYGINRENHGGMLETRKAIANDQDQACGDAVIRWAETWSLPIAVFASPRLPFAGKWRNVICWDKGEAVAGGGDILRCLKLSWELIQVARNGIIDGKRDGSVWRHTVTQKDFDNHPNEKPVPLMLRLIGTLFGDCETILDPFCGSGSTGVACCQLGKRFIGVELSPAYFNIAVRRIKAELDSRKNALFDPVEYRVTQKEMFAEVTA